MTKAERAIAHGVSDVLALVLAVVVFFVMRDALDAPRWAYWTGAVVTDLVVAHLLFQSLKEQW